MWSVGAGTHTLGPVWWRRARRPGGNGGGACAPPTRGLRVCCAHGVSVRQMRAVAAGPARDPGPADREGAALGAQPGRNGAERSGARRGDETPNRTPTAFWVHAARRQNSCSSATREATPANPGRPG